MAKINEKKLVYQKTYDAVRVLYTLKSQLYHNS